jgi:hypothetical protein
MPKSPKAAKPLTFRHRYYKLDLARAGKPFTTVRGMAQMKRLTVGQHLPVETPDGDFAAVITDLKLTTINDLGLPFLKADAEFPGNTISSPDQFVRLLNSFRAPSWTQATLDSQVTVLTLRKVDGILCHTCGGLLKTGSTACHHCHAIDTTN